MNFYCKDQTAGKLILATDFLSFLNGFTGQTIITCDAKDLSAYKIISNVFENISFTDIEPESCHVLFCENTEQKAQSGITFPIIHKDSGFVINSNTVVPVNKTKIIADNYLADQDSAKDMLVKLVTRQDLAGNKILISAGPTAEDFDPVRFLTNRSSGKMGLALARAAFIRGAVVKLVMGPGKVQPPEVLNTVFVRSAKEMADAVSDLFHTSDVYFSTAAIADYTPAKTRNDKIKKENGSFDFKLKRTTDVLASLGEKKQSQILVGFSVETTNIIENSLKKLERKKLDMIVINNPQEKGSGFEVDTNRASVLLKNGQMYKLPLQSKAELSHKILDFLKQIMD